MLLPVWLISVISQTTNEPNVLKVIWKNENIIIKSLNNIFKTIYLYLLKRVSLGKNYF